MPGKQQRPEKPRHDASYKNFFTHSQTVADTLRLGAGELARRLDFATLERLPASFVTEPLGQRHADMLWPASIWTAATDVGDLFGPVPEKLLGYQLPASGIFSSRSGRWTWPRCRRTTSWR